MTLFDYLVLLVIAAFTLISLFRGVVAELVGLVSWLGSLLAAKLLAPLVGDWLSGSLKPHALAVVAAFIGVFLLARLLFRLLQTLLTSSAGAAGLGGANRLLGGVFGAVKGVLAVTLAVLACAFTDLPKSEEWRHSQTAFVFEGLAQLAVPYLPPFMADRVDYRQAPGE